MATVFLSLSFTVVAEDSTVISQPENITDVTEEVSFADPDEFIPAVYEVEDLREESVKHFSLPDGTYQAVSYSGAVHRQNFDGTWRDIDNRLNAVTKNGFASYTTEDGRISFVQNTQSADGGSMLYTLTEGNYMIAMGIMGTSPSGNIMADDNAVLVSAGEVTNHAPKPEILVTDSAEEQLSKLRDIDNTTEILYEDILNDTDIEYVLTGNDVKENIIVKAKRDNYTYTFQMLVKGLTATANADGSITLSDETSGEAVYYIPAPYMYDANGEISYDVSYTLTEVFPEVYTLAVIADEAWIEAEDRAFPVVVDPFIASTTEAKDTVIDSNNVNSNYYGNLIRLPAKYNLTVLVQIEVPDLPYGALFNNNAQLCLFYYFHTSNPGYSRVSVYEMTGVWNEAEATYANSASLVGNTAVTNETLEWYEGMSDSEPGFAPLDISSTIYGWYYETPKDWQESYGFAVKYETEESTAPYIFFKSQECGNSEFTPFISVSYRTNIPDGVYSLENLYYDNHYINGGGYRSGTPVNVAEYDPEYYNEPTDDDSPKLDALFKISRDSDGNYIIRSMRNNALGIGTSSDSLALYSIPTNDADVDDYDKFQINWSNTDDSAVMIHPYGSTNVIYMSSLTSFDTVDEGSATASAKWRLKRYSGDEIFGAEVNHSPTIIEGEPTTFTAYSWSSSINANSIVLSANIQDPDYMKSVWYPELNKLIVYPYFHGIFTIIVKIQKNGSDVHTISFSQNINQNPDPLYKGTLNFIRYTDITTSTSSHLLTVINSEVLDNEVFIVRNNLNDAQASYLITQELISGLWTLENGFNSHLFPHLNASDNEKAAHAAKEETDQLIDAGYITYGSSEYYGSWASNYATMLEIGEMLTQYVNAFTAVYGVYQAITTCYYSYIYNTSYIISSAQYNSTANQIDDIATTLTHNNSSMNVMLGTSTDDLTWYSAGASQGMTYFYSSDWDTYVLLYGDDMMHAANIRFLQEQKIAGKQFYFSHDPEITLRYYKNSAFGKELQWLQEAYGLSELTSLNFVKQGSYWKFVPYP